MPCVGALIPRRSCSSTTLVPAPSAPPASWASVAGRLVRSAGQRPRLRLRPPAEWRADSGRALADGTVRGSSSRLLVEFLQERYELYAHNAMQ
jgi:hypothetical protein